MFRNVNSATHAICAALAVLRVERAEERRRRTEEARRRLFAREGRRGNRLRWSGEPWDGRTWDDESCDDDPGCNEPGWDPGFDESWDRDDAWGSADAWDEDGDGEFRDGAASPKSSAIWDAALADLADVAGQGDSDDARDRGALREKPLDRLCDALFHGPPQDDLAEPGATEPAALPVGGGQSESGRSGSPYAGPSCEGALAVIEPARAHRPAPPWTPPRRTPVPVSAGTATAVSVARVRAGSRWRRFMAIACLLLGGLLLFGATPQRWFGAPSAPPEMAAADSLDDAASEYVTTNIEDLQVGDWVLACDPETGEVEERQIVDAFHRTAYKLRVLEIRDAAGASQVLKTTDEHPFWVVGLDDFKPAGELKVGDRLLAPNGAETTLAATSSEPRPEGVTVYNFEVEGAHTYFVAQAGLPTEPVLVHNATARNCLDPSIIKPPGAGSKKGSYTIRFKSGMTYSGKGPWSRARASALRIQKETKLIGKEDKAVKINWKPSKPNTDKQAFRDEATRLKRYGGPGSVRNYNRINSPGKRR